jgi:hypothetical protein
MNKPISREELVDIVSQIALEAQDATDPSYTEFIDHLYTRIQEDREWVRERSGDKDCEVCGHSKDCYPHLAEMEEQRQKIRATSQGEEEK